MVPCRLVPQKKHTHQIIMSMAMPKNMDNLNLGLAACSAVGGLLLAYAYTGGRLATVGLPINLVTFAVITLSAKGAVFALPSPPRWNILLIASSSSMS